MFINSGLYSLENVHKQIYNIQVIYNATYKSEHLVIYGSILIIFCMHI